MCMCHTRWVFFHNKHALFISLSPLPGEERARKRNHSCGAHCRVPQTRDLVTPLLMPERKEVRRATKYFIEGRYGSEVWGQL